MIKIKQISKDGIELVTEVARENVIESLEGYFKDGLSKITFLIFRKNGEFRYSYDLVGSVLYLDQVNQVNVGRRLDVPFSPSMSDKKVVLESLRLSIKGFLKETVEITFEE